MKDVMIATGNKDKVREYKEMLEPLGYIVHDLSEIEHIEVEENGTTFAENALIKARSVANKVDMICIADDSGLCVEALNNEPGIYSARYMAGCDYTTKNLSLIERVKDKDNRRASFHCAIALVEKEKEVVFEGVMNGEIAYEIKGENGFGYDPIFYLPEYGQTSAQLSPLAKNAISHRGQATRKLVEYLKENY